jgi:hypothetical protein
MTITETQPRTVEQLQVERGSAWLDEYRPKWDEEIDLAVFDINNCDRCILGQLFGAYYATVAKFGFSRSDEFELGFCGPPGGSEGWEKSWELLTEAWRDEIARRRTGG